MLHSAQIRAARALLSWSQEDLSAAAGVALGTVYKLEKAHGPATANMSTLLRIEAAFQRAGVRFIAEDERGGVGLRLTQSHRREPGV